MQKSLRKPIETNLYYKPLNIIPSPFLCYSGTSRVFDPLVFGEYPSEMRNILGNQLPSFTPKEKSLIKGSLDFIGLNHYSTLYVKDCSFSACALGGNHAIRGFLETTGFRDGIPIGDLVHVQFCYAICNLNVLLVTQVFDKGLDWTKDNVWF